MTSFSKPSRSRLDPAAADAFIAGADVGPTNTVAVQLPPSTEQRPTNAVAVRLPPSTEQRPRRAPPPSDTPEPTPNTEREPEVASQTIRFTAREKAALQRLARAQRRSEHFILKEILTPALLAADQTLDAS
jgi:hypothetical protein